MTRDELDKLMELRELPDEHRMLRDVLAGVAAERTDPTNSREDPERVGFSDSAFRPIPRTPARRWLALAVAAAMVVVIGGIGWSVTIQSPLAPQPGGQSVPGPTQTPQRQTPEATSTPEASVTTPLPPTVRVLENRVADQALFVTYEVCSGSGVALLTGPFAARDTDIVLPSGLPPRMNVEETIGPDECIVRGEAFARPDGPVWGRLDVQITFASGAPESNFTAFYGDSYGG